MSSKTLLDNLEPLMPYMGLSLEDTAEKLCDTYPNEQERLQAIEQYTYQCVDARDKLLAISDMVDTLYHRLLWASENA